MNNHIQNNHLIQSITIIIHTNTLHHESINDMHEIDHTILTMNMQEQYDDGTRRNFQSRGNQ